MENEKEIDIVNRPKSLVISFGHKDWILVQYILLGIGRSVAEINAQSTRNPVESDFSQSIEFELPSVEGKVWKFVNSSPLIFKQIRNLFKVDAKEYMFSLGPKKILGNLLLGNLCALDEVVSTGRSGSFFFKTHDQKYFIKTLPSAEESFLLTYLKDYYEYVQQNPNTLLPRFYGLYQIKPPGGKSIPFVIMSNVFDPTIRINEQYDLKGSTQNRHVSSNNPEVAKKDLDFHHKINLGSSRKALVLEQLEKDTFWLQSKNICDYSLLVGIYFTSTEKMSNQQCMLEDNNEISIFKKHFGGMLSILDAVEYLEQTSSLSNNTSDNSGEKEEDSPEIDKNENQTNQTNQIESEEEKYKKWEYATVAMQQRGHSLVII
eukprot:TRINITY_DN14382_c0_g1_i1.p1 TRINITY_DN14382_c0_g1~~TRINITY_DN14382_c0_g1_i1.p1  ORF type:complete len:375 (-),score=119.29 TRINITY_DN14382_c0_g1_i1:48-1172(-)